MLPKLKEVDVHASLEHVVASIMRELKIDASCNGDPTRVAQTATSHIYRIDDNLSAQPFGLKILRARHQHVESLRSRFEYEADILASLSHSALPRLEKSGRSGGRSFMFYRYIVGATLRERLGHLRALSPNEACLIVLALLDVFAYLHGEKDLRIVHGDISPENVILSRSGVVCLIDFGVAQRLRPGHTIDTRWIGKPSYLSPEQASGNTWDHRSDLYQLGLVFYEMLAGRKRASARNFADALRCAARQTAADFSAVPIPLRPVLERLIQVDPDARYENARQVSLALGQARARLKS